ncbi:unnamed protein product [Brassica rapa]|uniref:Bromo domain-containing protein n=1 Tax=Brassica campestris TaxID=3711 RepID=A0A8D9HZ86_BRACM|nr:unnamed protein product [Brassica rapa]
MKHRWSSVFNTPVDVLGLGLHGYHLIVKKPMDLGTVKTNLEKGFYRSPVDFASDVSLTFTNALAYNPKGQDVYKMAEKLLSQFDISIAKKLDSLKLLLTLPLPRVPSPPPSPPPQPVVSKVETPPPQPPQPVNQVEASPLEVGEAPNGRKGKLPKPKAKDPNKREMTMEEKGKLGVNLQELPPEKLGQLIQILKKRTMNLPKDGDEIELDIEELDNETLWELDRFVTNYKKMASKIKRQGFIQNLSTPTRNLACHARKSAPGVQLGLSELQLGVNPRKYVIFLGELLYFVDPVMKWVRFVSNTPTYILMSETTMKLNMEASAENKNTPINLAQNTYWNLAGNDSWNILDHMIQIWGPHITHVDQHTDHVRSFREKDLLSLSPQ